MKNNILNDLKEYREFLNEKLGFNNILDLSNNYHASLDKVDNGINRYLRERLGNLILKENSIEDCGDKINYNYKDYENSISYIGTFDKNNNVFILREFYENTIKENRYYLVIDEIGIKYLKYNEVDKYLIVEELKYGKKVDICSITTKFYDSSVVKFLTLGKNKLDYHCVDKINNENIIPEIEFVSKTYENNIRKTIKKGIITFDYIADEYILVNGVLQGTDKVMADASFLFNEKKDEAIDLCVCRHFTMIKKK